MDQYEMSHSKGAEIPSYQQTDENDARVLQNLGYKQQLNRKFGFMSSFGLTTTVMATCEFQPERRVIISYPDQRCLNRGSILCDIHNCPYQRRSCTYTTYRQIEIWLLWLTKLNPLGRLGLWVLFLLHRDSLHLRFSRRICVHVSHVCGAVSLGRRIGTEEALSNRQLDLRMDHILGMATHYCIPSISWSYHDPISSSAQLSWLS
jgi:hypothetical protein